MSTRLKPGANEMGNQLQETEMRRRLLALLLVSRMNITLPITLSRRTFLRGDRVTLALPLREAMTPWRARADEGLGSESDRRK